MSKPQMEDHEQSDEGAIVDESVSPEYAGTDLRRKRDKSEPTGESKPAGETVRHQPAPQGSVDDDVERGAVDELEEQADGTPTEGGPLVQPNRQEVQEG